MGERRQGFFRDASHFKRDLPPLLLINNMFIPIHQQWQGGGLSMRPRSMVMPHYILNAPFMPPPSQIHQPMPQAGLLQICTLWRSYFQTSRYPHDPHEYSYADILSRQPNATARPNTAHQQSHFANRQQHRRNGNSPTQHQQRPALHKSTSCLSASCQHASLPPASS
jgi:hypothetical protein